VKKPGVDQRRESRIRDAEELSTNIEHEPLDKRQIARIEAVHQGFLFQHLYAVQILLSSLEVRWTSVKIERDEDIEIKLPGLRAYVQVKKRATELAPGDIKSSLEQFVAIQAEHQAGRRDGTSELWIVSNVGPSKSLAKDIASNGWQPTAFVLTPVFSNSEQPRLPAPSSTLDEQFVKCAELASRVQHSTLSPETLVWKLAAWIQAVAGGSVASHEITPSTLQPLLEQLVVQLQEFPAPTANYRPQEDEPAFISEDRIRLIVGHSGAGKTCWAGEFGLHQGANAIYFDCTDLPGSALAASLVRELAARLLVDREERRMILLPGAEGIQGLRLINNFIALRAESPYLVIDNIQRIGPQDVYEIAESLSTFRLLLLAQPGPQIGVLEGRLALPRENLRGWSIRTIADEAQELGCFANPATCEEVRVLTAGSPLFVRDLCRIAASAVAGDLAAASDLISSGLHERTTYQELIVTQVLQHLDERVLQAVTLLALGNMALKRSLAVEVVATGLSVERRQVAGFFRKAAEWGITQNLPGSKIALHEAFRTSLVDAIQSLPQQTIHSAREALRNGLFQDMEGGGIEQYLLMAQLCLDTGQISTLIDMATSSAELVREHGADSTMRSFVAKAAVLPDITDEDRFWALDTLAFWDISDDELDKAQVHLDGMAKIHEERALLPRAKSAYAIKLLTLAGKRESLKELKKAIQRCKKMGLDPMAWRIARYNYAAGLHLCGENNRAIEITEILGREYYEIIELDPLDVFAANLDEMAVMLGDLMTKGDDLKRLADCLDLRAKALLATGEESHFCRIHAHKFYVLAGAYTSAIKVGQDFVDECLRVRADQVGARMFLEGSLLPVVKDLKLLGYLVPVTCQYAVVLAYCGKSRAARQNLEDMKRFIVPGTLQEAEYLGQCDLVEDILTRGLTIEMLNALLD
jgi:hypothetical protein